MAYGTIKVDNITFDNGGVDKLITVSGLFYSTSGALTVTGTISGGNVVAPTATFTTLTGTTTAGTTATFTSGSFTSLTGVTATISSGIFAAGSATAPSVAVGTGTTYKPGIYSPGTDQLAISTAGVGQLFVDASGKVGIGTTPNYNLHTTETVAVTSAASYSTFLGQGTRADLVLKATSSNNDQQRQVVRSNSDSLIFGTEDATVSVFTEKARIDSSGRLLVGVIASPAHQLQVATDSAGKPSTNTWTIVSDERIKEDIELADLSLCYQAVKYIPLKRYKWKDTVYTEEQVHDRHKLGWISQDVKAVFPKAVRISEFKYNQVFSETVIPAVDEELDEDGNVVIPSEPERIEKELVSEDIIEDCHDLNADQLYAAMYGAVQMLMIKVEALEAQVAPLL